MQNATTEPGAGAGSAVDDIGRYLREASRVPLLTAAQETNLAERIEVGCYAQHLLTGGALPEGATVDELEWMVIDGARAHEQFIVANLRLVVSVARRYASTGVALLDVVQEGNTGLLRAVQKFDHTRGFKFSTYGTLWIRQFILRSMNVHTRSVRVPIHLHEQMTRIRALTRTLGIELGRDPTPMELAAAAGMSVQKVRDLSEYERVLATISLDAPVEEGGTGTTIGDLVGAEPSPGPEEVVVRDQHAAGLRAVISELDPRLADIVIRRYGLGGRPPARFTEIGRRWDITAQRVRQLLQQALCQLRTHEAELVA